MATDPATIAFTVGLAQTVMQAVSGWVLWHVPHRSARLLATIFLAGAVVGLLSGSMRSLDESAWSVAFEFWKMLTGVLMVGFMWIYPERPRGRLERALLIAYPVWAVIIFGLWQTSLPWLMEAPPGVDFRTTAKWYWISPHSLLLELLYFACALLWYRRAFRHEGPERRAAPLWITFLLFPIAIRLSYNTFMTWNVWRFDNWQYHEWRPITGVVAGDVFGLTTLLWLATWTTLFGILAYTVSKRSYSFAIIAAITLVFHLFRDSTAIDLFAFVPAVSICYFTLAVTHHNVFGVHSLTRPLGFTLAGGLSLALFFTALAAALAISDDSLLLGAGIAFGLLLAAFAFVSVLRKVEGMPSSLVEPDPATTRSRIEPYHAVLLQELSSGTPPKETFEKLKPLRARLGISDHEHALLEYASGGAHVARLTERAVQPGQTFLSRYRVARTLKEGGMGVTHLATDERVGRRVVLKTLRSVRGGTSLDGLLKEARAMGRLEHANVVRLIDADVVGEEAFLVMEYLEGGSLADRLEKGPLARAQFVRVAADLLAALEAVHEAGLVHRDVKPSNVLLTTEGSAKLADFGVAHLPGFETTAGAVPAEGAVGTIRYMSPEQARGRPAGPRSDLYSAAVVLYEALSGRSYHEVKPNESAVELQLRVAAVGGFARADVPEVLRPWFARALHPVASERFESARAMRNALDAALAQGSWSERTNAA